MPDWILAISAATYVTCWVGSTVYNTVVVVRANRKQRERNAKLLSLMLAGGDDAPDTERSPRSELAN